MNQLQKNLLYLIDKNGTNPTALAAATGVTQPTLHRILTGESKDPRTSNLEKIAAYFNVTVDVLRSEDLETSPFGGTQQFLQQSLKKVGELRRQSDASSSESSAPVLQAAPGLHALSANRAVEKAFLDALSPEFRGYTQQAEQHFGRVYRFDYCSDKVVAELIALPAVGRLGRGLLYSSLIRPLWRLSTHRLITSSTKPERQYFLFVTTPLGASSGPVPLDVLSFTITEAKLHQIEVVWASPADAAEWVNGVETGRILSLTDPEDFERDELY